MRNICIYRERELDRRDSTVQGMTHISRDQPHTRTIHPAVGRQDHPQNTPLHTYNRSACLSSKPVGYRSAPPPPAFNAQHTGHATVVTVNYVPHNTPLPPAPIDISRKACSVYLYRYSLRAPPSSGKTPTWVFPLVPRVPDSNSGRAKSTHFESTYSRASTLSSALTTQSRDSQKSSSKNASVSGPTCHVTATRFIQYLLLYYVSRVLLLSRAPIKVRRAKKTHASVGDKPRKCSHPNRDTTIRTNK